jgi:hypothetical protein
MQTFQPPSKNSLATLRVRSQDLRVITSRRLVDLFEDADPSQSGVCSARYRR